MTNTYLCCRVRYHWGTEAERQLWWSSGFYLQVGGAEQNGERRHIRRWKKIGRWEERICTGKQTTSGALQHRADEKSEGERGDLTICATIYHEEEDSRLTWTSLCILCTQNDLRGRVLFWLAGTCWGQTGNERGGFCGNYSAFTVVDKTISPQSPFRRVFFF